MKTKIIMSLALLSLLNISTACGRHIRTAQDVTPGNCPEHRLDWRYGATDIRIQTSKINSQLMNRWFAKTGYVWDQGCKPRIIITQVDNRTDCFISTDMIRDIIEGVAIDDGRYSIIVGDCQDERELDKVMAKISCDPKYSNNSRLANNGALAPQFLGKIRITKATTSDRYYDYEDYRMTITLYDIETQEAIDSAWDVLSKRVQAR